MTVLLEQLEHRLRRTCYVMPCCVILNDHVDACGLRAVGSYFRVKWQGYE